MPLKSTNRISVLVLICFINLYIKAQTTIVNQPFSSTIPSGWSADASSWTLNTNYATNDHTPNDYCASIASGKPSKYIYIPVTMLAGAKYDLSFWTKRIGGISVYINETADQVTPLFTYTVTQTLDNNWKQTTCTSYIALTSGQFYFQIAYTGSTYGSGTAYLDDVQLIETSSGNQNSWSITGSSGTNMISNFIGTTDAQGLVFKTNNIERAQFDMSGNFVLNTGGIFKNDLKLEKGFTFDGSKGIKFIPGQDNGGIFRYGNNNLLQPLSVPCAATPYSPITHQFGGWLQIYDYINPSTSGLLNLQTWSGGSSIDASIGGQTGGGGLLLNYFCGNDVAICTGANGGRVAMGKVVNIGGAWPINLNTALDIRANGTKGLAIQNTNAVEIFSVANDGKTTITTTNQDAFDIIDPSTGKVNYRVKATGFTYAREINVQLADFPDYVFAKGYSLMSLEEVEKYILANKHLPNVPTAKEIDDNGANLGELNKIQMEKIEELTLYIIELKKELEELKKQISNGK